MNLIWRLSKQILITFLLITGAQAAFSQSEFPYKNSSLPIDERVKDLLSRMTTEEKFWQLFMIPGEKNGVDEKYILGGQANLWTEQVPTIRHAFYMTYPRAFATSESVWSPKESKNWDSFVGRVESHFHRFDVAEQSICKAIYDPIVKTKKDGDKLLCDLSSDIQGVELYYTTDNTFPDKYTPKFSSTFEIPTGDVTLKVAAYRNGRPIGRVLSIKRDDLIKRAGK